MGTGTDAAAKISPEHAAAIDNMKDQLLIAFLKELKARGHDLVFPVAEIDGTGQDLLYFYVNERREFAFDLRKKS